MLGKFTTLLRPALSFVGALICAAMVLSGLRFWFDLIWSGMVSTEFPAALASVSPIGNVALIAVLGILIFLGVSDGTPPTMRKH